MNHKKYMSKVRLSNVYRGITILGFALFVAGMSAIFPGIVYGAREENSGGMSERKWDLAIGAGAEVSPKYLGADEVEVKPAPVIEGRYRTTYVDLFSSSEGVGLTFKVPDRDLLFLSAGVNLGKGRDNSYVSILKKTADIKVPVEAFGRLDIPIVLGDLSAKLSYFPISSDYEDADQEDKTYDGLLAQLNWGSEVWFLENLFLNVEGGVSWMNEDYAKANYSIEYQTEHFDTFAAKSGLHDAHASAELVWFFTRHWGTALTADVAYLLESAADSPLTENDIQPFGGLFLLYNF